MVVCLLLAFAAIDGYSDARKLKGDQAEAVSKAVTQAVRDTTREITGKMDATQMLGGTDMSERQKIAEEKLQLAMYDIKVLGLDLEDALRDSEKLHVENRRIEVEMRQVEGEMRKRHLDIAKIKEDYMFRLTEISGQYAVLTAHHLAEAMAEYKCPNCSSQGDE